mgnify:CR=1 FL=1
MEQNQMCPGLMPPANKISLAMAYVPMQQAEMRNLFDPEYGLKEGTIFPILNKPMGVYGKQTKGDIIFKNGGM